MRYLIPSGHGRTGSNVLRAAVQEAPARDWCGKNEIAATMNLMLFIQRGFSLLGRLVYGFSAAVEKHKTIAVLCYSTLFLSVCALLSAVKLMWYDEMATYYPAKLPTLSELVNFFWNGLDVHTPTTSLVLRATMQAFGDGPVVDRLPFALGFLVFCISIFAFVARRCPAVYAAAAMIFPGLTLMFFYATEIRCYGLVLGLSGVALVCWQSAVEGPYRRWLVAGLFLSLAGAISCHYYAAFLLIPFGLAELTRTVLLKRIDWPIWIALTFSPAVILIFLPAIRVARSAYAGNMWAKPHLSQIATSYQVLLSISTLPIVFATIVCLLAAPRLPRPLSNRFASPPAEEWVLAGTLSLLPVLTVPISMLVGAFTERYVLPSVAGVAILLVFALYRATRDAFFGGVLALVFLAGFVFKNVPEISRQMAKNGGLKTPLGSSLWTTNWSRELEQSELPVAVTPSFFFMQLQHYASDRTRSRLYYLADEQLSSRYGGISTNDLNLLRFRQSLPLRVVGFQEFISRNRHFLMCSGTEPGNWLPAALLNLGAQMSLRTTSSSYVVFEVTIPESLSSARTATAPGN